MKFTEVQVDSVLWEYIKKTVMSSAGPKVSVNEWIDEAIREKIMREPSHEQLEKKSEDLFSFLLKHKKRAEK